MSDKKEKKEELPKIDAPDKYQPYDKI